MVFPLKFIFVLLMFYFEKKTVSMLFYLSVYVIVSMVITETRAANGQDRVIKGDKFINFTELMESRLIGAAQRSEPFLYAFSILCGLT